MNITLIGMPGSGKSSVGRILARRLGYAFLDVDPLIVERHGAGSLQQVLDQLGNEGFLDAEAEVISSLSCADTILAPGGSAVLREKGARRLRELGKVVYLKLPCAALEQRLWNLSSRGVPLAPGQTLSQLYAQRKPFYERYADVTVNAALLRAEDTAEEILRALEL